MSSFNFGWVLDPTKEQLRLSSQINSEFFDNLTEGLTQINGITLTKREGQVTYAKQIMEAIKEQKMLFIQAGVGIGKSYGYLIPIIITLNNVQSFNKIVIATSSRALQQQLLTDVHNVSRMLDIPIDANIVKGINNYVCLRKLNNLIVTDEELRKELLSIRKEILESKRTADREELSKISNEVWEQIMADNRGVCSKCELAPRCYYQQLQEKIKSDDQQIIITNQALMAYWFKENLIDDVDILVVDEGHNLEDNINQVLGGILELDDVKKFLINMKRGELYEPLLIENCIHSFEKLYREIRYNAKEIYKANNSNAWIDDGQEVVFDLRDDKVRKIIDRLITNLEKLIVIVEHRILDSDGSVKKQLRRYKSRLDAFLLIMKDIYKLEKQDNFYWVKFIDFKRIEIHYTRKKMNQVTDFIKSIPTTVFTSGTLIGADGSYTDFEKSIFGDSISDDLLVQYATPINSNFNYKENTLVYYDPTIAPPATKANRETYNEEQYIQDLTDRIDKLIRMSEGKALILFTSNDIMKKVYDRISKKDYPFKIMLQDKSRNSEIKQEFSNNTNSCLFATGSYWEGIDIKGESLSNLIITRLPFPVEDGKSQLTGLYLYKMLIKLQQGFGRAIRSEDDKALISILDSRMPRYLKAIEEVLPTPKENYTTDLNVVEAFVESKIVDKKLK